MNYPNKYFTWSTVKTEFVYICNLCDAISAKLAFNGQAFVLIQVLYLASAVDTPYNLY